MSSNLVDLYQISQAVESKLEEEENEDSIENSIDRTYSPII